MRDLTEGSINRHLVAMATPIAAGMIFQTLYFLVDLYFVGRLGGAAIAGVGSAGNLTFLVMALTQVLGVGTVALIAQAVGRKDQPRANLVFNQSSVLAMAALVACLVLGYPFAAHFADALGSDAATRAAGATYLRWYLPGLALQFALVAMASALRGTGIVKPAMTAQMLTVVINVILAPVLIGGWGTGHPLGVAGAGLASTIAITVGVLLMWMYFLRLEHYVGFVRSDWRPRIEVWRQILAIGLPAGGEFVVMFVIFSFIYFVIRPFGASAQAGFGVGTRVMQAIFLPAMAVAFAVAPIVGQNFGAGRPARVRQTFRSAAKMSVVLMLVVMGLCLGRPALLIGAFISEPEAIRVGSDYLRFVSWNCVASGFVFVCSGVLQGLGNTWPALWSSGSRLITFIIPVWWLSTRPGFSITQIWMVSVASVTLQALLSGTLALRQMRLRLVA
ncbi:MAG TPA: MATE family efflux transporter [Steroidobacteraceae bacterium]|nr:MATE family efflux transporter [Steroidobacteraceae bacterium]